MKLHTLLILSGMLVTMGAWAAPFGSVPIDSPGTQVKAPVAAPPVPPQVRVGSGTARQAPPPQPAGSWSAPPAPVAPPGGKKWVQDPQGIRYQVSTGALLPPGWVETAPPAQPPLFQAPVMQAPPIPPPSVPQTYSGVPQPAIVPPVTAPPATTYNPYVQPTAPQTTTGTPPGKKRLRHASGYEVIVSQSTIPGPEFTEIPSTPAAPTAPVAPQPAAPGVRPLQPVLPQQPQTYTPIQPQPGQVTGGLLPYQQPVVQQPVPQQPAYYQQPQTYNAPPQLPHVPPTWQQQLPYQPPQPQYQAPVAGMVPGQAPYYQQQPQAPLPVVRKTPPGKKWVADQSGLRYLVSESTVVMPPMREVTEEELNQPIHLGQQPQQQQQGSAIGRFFQGIRGN